MIMNSASRIIVIGSRLAAATCAVASLSAQDGFKPAKYLSGELPGIAPLATGGGEILLEATITETGVVSDIQVLRATPPFTEPVTEAVRGWRFSPAEDSVDGKGAAAPPSHAPATSNVLVAASIRPPSINTPTLGEPPSNISEPSDAVPYPLATVTPPYPPLARDAGQVLVEVSIDEKGKVSQTRVVRPAAPFDGPAQAAAKQWRFRPAMHRGHPVRSIAYIMFAFRQPVT
jgi:TonB family protein